MRTEALYLTDMVEAADAIARFLVGVDRETFFKDEMRWSAVIQKLIVIGEAASRLSTALKNRHAHIEWLEMECPIFQVRAYALRVTNQRRNSY